MEPLSAKRMDTVTSLESIDGVRVGKIVQITENGEVLIDFQDNKLSKIPAKFTRSQSLETLKQAALNKSDVLLVFENNNPHHPIIIDVLHSFIDELEQAKELDLEVEKTKDVTVDGKVINFDAKEQIVLRCGKASITLTKAGKILIRGAYLLNRSSGVNRIKGGSVQIN